ncbi:MAG TPA: M20 family metallo-hydrolase [Bryobacteraceae bacterium]|jgi:N-carbamoyl-L-amino-acid hydrolase|nr:M20 family metallo-hydrolase [Bryobacteraceae bacterium]
MSVVAELEQLAAFSTASPPAVTRVVFSQEDMHARACLKQLCRNAGLAIREDAVGNMFARWHGTNPQAGAVGTGSHIDAIPNSGRYDGTVGVLGGLEAIRLLQRSRFQPERSIDLLLFTSEEPTRFGIGCLGSRLLSGTLDPAVADNLVDAEGQSLRELRNRAGFQGPLQEVRLSPDHYSAFIELHIEQGPLLESSGTALGIVTALAAPASLRLEIHGEGGHAGAVLMPHRRDAFIGASEIALAIEKAALSTGAPDTVATTGCCHVFPNAVNSIPSRVTLEVDVRDIEGERRDSVVRIISDAAKRIASERRLQIEIAIVNADPPAYCDERVVAALEQAAAALGLPQTKMISRAYHDSLFMSRIAPVGMLFIPCRGGVSHRPDEYAAPEHIADGVRTLAEALRLLASGFYRAAKIYEP